MGARIALLGLNCVLLVNLIFWSQRRGSIRGDFQGPLPNSSGLGDFHGQQYLGTLVQGSSGATYQIVKPRGCMMLLLAEVWGPSAIAVPPRSILEN